MKINTKNSIWIIFLLIIPLFLLNSIKMFSQLEDNNRIYLGDEIGYQHYYLDKISFNKCSNKSNFEYHYFYNFDKYIRSLNRSFNSISDKKTGELLFFTDGLRVYNKNFKIMENGDSIIAIKSSLAYSCDNDRRNIIIPYPESNSKYYIFSIGVNSEINYKSLAMRKVEYAIIDMSINNGLGKAITKGISIDTNIYKYYSIAAIAHKNGRDFWLLAKDTCGNITTFLVNKNEIKFVSEKKFNDISNLFYSFYNKYYSKQSYFWNWLTMKVSPNGKNILLFDLGNVFSDSLSRNNRIYDLYNHQIIANFNNETGELLNPVTIYNPTAINYQAVEYFFTPDSKKLFISEYNTKKITEINLSTWDSLQISNSIQTKSLKNNEGITFSYKDYPLRDGKLYIQSDSMIPKRNIIKVDNFNEGILNKNIDFNYLKLNLTKDTKLICNGDLVYNSVIYHSFLYHFIDYKKPICETKKLEFDLLPFVPKGAEEDPKVIFEWKGPDKFYSLLRKPEIDSVTYKNSGWYYLTLFSPEDTLRDSLYIDIPIDANIKISASKNSPCPGDTVILKIDSTFKSIYWNTGDSTKSIKVTKPGKYTIMIEDENCCNSYDEIEVVYAIPPNPEIEIIGNNPSCYGDTVIIKPKYNYPIISWDDGDPNRIRKITKTTAYELTVIDSNGCSAKSTIEIKFANKPKPSITGDTKICLGTISTYEITTNKTTKKDITISGGTIKSRTENEIRILWDKVGDYLVEIIETDTINGCTGKTSLNITVDSLKKPTIRQDIPLCYGSIGKLSVLETNDTYLWSTGEKTQSIFVTKSGTYKVVCTLSGGCSDSSEIIVNEVPKPKIEIISDKGNTICQKGEKITLSVNPNDPEYSYFWSTGLITPSITVSDSGTYYLFAVNKYGCADTAIYRINIAPEFTPEITANKFKICKGEELELSANPNQTDYKYLWSNGLTSSKITIKDPGTYKLKVSNQFGCTKEIEQKIGLNPTISIKLDTSRAEIGNSTEITMTIFCESKIQLNNIEIKLIIDGSSLLITEEQKYLTYNYLPNQNLELILKIDSIDFNKSSKMQYKVRGNTLLANNLNNPIIIDNVSLKSDEFCIEKIPGALILEKICTYDLRKVKLIEEFNFEILPNPASDYIEVTYTSNNNEQSIIKYDIYNIYGENILCSSSHFNNNSNNIKSKIDISTLPTGVYFIEIGDKFEKFVKM